MSVQTSAMAMAKEALGAAQSSRQRVSKSKSDVSSFLGAFKMETIWLNAGEEVVPTSISSDLDPRFLSTLSHNFAREYTLTGVQQILRAKGIPRRLRFWVERLVQALQAEDLPLQKISSLLGTQWWRGESVQTGLGRARAAELSKRSSPLPSWHAFAEISFQVFASSFQPLGPGFSSLV